MDPLSITTTAIALASRCWATGKDIYDVLNAHKTVPETLELIVHHIYVTKGALSGISRVLEVENISALSPELEDIFPSAIKGFEAVLLCLENEFLTLKEYKSWWNRVRMVWKES
jgi:hypothetical protein